MKNNNWQELDFSEFEEQEQYDKKKNQKLNKRKWREIEALKEQHRERKEMASFDLYYSM
ncbi:MAG: DUF3545 family protein [Colwellia sp.]